MNRRVLWLIVAVTLLLVGSAFSVGALASGAREQAAHPELAYVFHGRLWLRSLSSGSTWHVPTPLPVSGVSWSPGGDALAFAGTQGVGVVAIQGHNSRALFWRRLPGYRYGQRPPIWSPNGRYMVFTANMRDKFRLLDDWIWDRTSDRTWLLARGVLNDFNSRSWSNDSSRIIVGVRQSYWSRPPAWKPVAEVITVQTGAIRRLGKGAAGPWSPDDRFIGFDLLWGCGVTGCLFQEGLMPSSGGRMTILTHFIRTWDANEVWAPRQGGYAYDRWLLDGQGRLLRRIPGQYVNVEKWSPDGRWVAVRSLTQALRIVLTLVSARTMGAAQIYMSAPTDGCDACTHQGYDVTWNHSGSAFAMLTPDTNTPFGQEVKPSLYINTLRPGHMRPHLSVGLQMRDRYPVIVGWANHDRQLLIYAHRALLSLVPGQRRLFTLVRNLPSRDGTYFFGGPYALRPGL